MARVQVKVVDINDNRPAFYPVLYTVSLSTHSAPGTSVAKVTANDPDAGENGRVTYRTVPGGGSAFFTLNKDTGKYPVSNVQSKVITVVMATSSPSSECHTWAIAVANPGRAAEAITPKT